ncbi:MAG: helix-turn-helix domain-containing protein [Muribaculaceae bacterium]|nr:helix-turn-helix domain-containing protein [Muribaculaceae bacterium]
MQKERKQVKSMSCHGFSQFELSKNVLNNLSQYNLKPVAKLVLLYLCDCYNPKKEFIFPKQKTIAEKLGVSEVSVTRAISELHKEHLIISERKYTLHYRFTSKIVSGEATFQQNNMTDETHQKDNEQPIKKTAHVIEQKKELNKPTSVDDFKILKDYAEKHNAKNVTAYINYLKRNGLADKIIADFKAKEASDRFFAKQIEETKLLIEQRKQDAETSTPPTQSWKDLKSKLLAL